jgi:hypothetical protein
VTNVDQAEDAANPMVLLASTRALSDWARLPRCTPASSPPSWAHDPHADDQVKLVGSLPVLTDEQLARVTELANSPHRALPALPEIPSPPIFRRFHWEPRVRKIAARPLRAATASALFNEALGSLFGKYACAVLFLEPGREQSRHPG